MCIWNNTYPLNPHCRIAAIAALWTEFSLLIKDQPAKVYTEFAPLEADFAAEKIHPLDLKESVIAVLNNVSGLLNNVG